MHFVGKDVGIFVQYIVGVLLYTGFNESHI